MPETEARTDAGEWTAPATHPIQDEMRRIESDKNIPLGRSIAEMIEYDGDLAELHDLLGAETERVVQMAAKANYDVWNLAAVGLLQGVTLARAGLNVAGNIKIDRDTTDFVRSRHVLSSTV